MTPQEARLINEEARYSIAYHLMYNLSGDHMRSWLFDVYWQTSFKRIKHIATRYTYIEADRAIRAHIYKQRRRRAKPPVLALLTHCVVCDRLCHMLQRYAVCTQCDHAYPDYVPDDDPGFDPMFLL